MGNSYVSTVKKPANEKVKVRGEKEKNADENISLLEMREYVFSQLKRCHTISTKKRDGTRKILTVVHVYPFHVQFKDDMNTMICIDYSDLYRHYKNGLNVDRGYTDGRSFN